MSNMFLPEGRLLNTTENINRCASLPNLQSAMDCEEILEGQAIMCTPDQDLIVSVGDYTGIICREEAAIGIREGTVRDIAILSRVGKAVSFTITAIHFDCQPPVLELSRRRAQELALDFFVRKP